MLDRVNSSDEILSVFRVHYDRAELVGLTDPSLLCATKAKLDWARDYDAKSGTTETGS